jgi:hypothetical protein
MTVKEAIDDVLNDEVLDLTTDAFIEELEKRGYMIVAITAYESRWRGSQPPAKEDCS